MTSRDYNNYLDAIKTANNLSDKEMRKSLLAQIKARLIVDYGLNDEDAKYLINKCG